MSTNSSSRIGNNQLTVHSSEDIELYETTAGNSSTGSPSKARRRGSLASQTSVSSGSQYRRKWLFASIFGVLLFVIGAGILVKVIVDGYSRTADAKGDASSGRGGQYIRLEWYNYSACTLGWNNETSTEDDGGDTEPLCSSLDSELVCSSTVHCCWVPESNACATYQGEEDCIIRATKDKCEESDYCVWRYDSQCRRGFPKSEEQRCFDGWNLSAPLTSVPCAGYDSNRTCAVQPGCCWSADKRTCEPFRNSAECHTHKTRIECENSLGICAWENGFCLRGLEGHQTTSNGSASIPTNPVRRTNIVILLSDDLGYGDPGYNGGISRTPNIDAISRSPHALRLDNHHSMSVCSPSRCMILSGQYPERNCVPGARLYETLSPPQHLTTVAHDAKRAGYRTAFFGKWHLGEIQDNMIGRMGFDVWTASYGNLVAFDTTCFCNEIACKASSRCDLPQRMCYRFESVCSSQATQSCILGHMDRADFIVNPPRNFECDMMELQKDGTVQNAAIPRGSIVCEYLGAKFEQFISSTPLSVPILALVFFSEVHIPFVADPVRRREVERFHNLPAGSRQANYVSSLENVDRVVGEIRRLLKDYRRADDTLLIFTSDNGPETWRIGGAGSPGPLRGWKRTVFEGGLRVPTVLEWPRRIQQNVQVKQVTAHADFRATLQDLLRQENPALSFPDTDDLDGVSLLPLIRSPGTWRRGRELLICEPQIAGTDRVCNSFALYSDSFKLIATRGAELSPMRNALFDLSVDIGETTNLAVKKSKLYLTLAARARSMIEDVLRSYNSRCR